MNSSALSALVCLSTVGCLLPAQDDAPAPAGLRTRWADEVTPANAHREHPRPHLVRASWASLNGTWQLAIVPRHAPQPDHGDYVHDILVPFPIESALSGVQQHVRPDQEAVYRRSFRIDPAIAAEDRVLLHFGAVDWRCEVRVNGRVAGTHRGGYDPFHFDVSHLVDPERANELVVRVWDPSDAGTQPCGKQTLRPRGIWYTAVTGIWGSVWLEGVPSRHLRDVHFDTDWEQRTVTPVVDGPGIDGLRLHLRIGDAEPYATLDTPAGAPAALAAPDPRPWSPEDPVLHHVQLELRDGDEVVDRVTSYFAFRKIEVRPDAHGTPRLVLNDTPRFQLGLLDQGYWPDGLYTAPTDDALRYDLEVTKRLGYDTVRKHVKIEPSRWYHHCDELGLLVWQDLPSGGPRIRPDADDLERDAQEVHQFEHELRRMIATHRHHPSVIGWVVFNEGWGQHQTARYAELVQRLDPTRLVDAVSGWADRGVGDLHDIHRYPGPALPRDSAPRAAFLGEFGGLGLPLPGHLWQEDRNWGYRSYDDRAGLTDAYVALLEQLPVLAARGLTGAIYTQTTDVEIEVNGVMTYDRAVVKLDEERLRAVHQRLRGPLPSIEVLLPTAADGPPAQWRYTFESPPADWAAPDFDASAWDVGPAGFGTQRTPHATVGTVWDTSDVWLRRRIELPADTSGDGLHLLLHHDEAVTVFVDGEELVQRDGYTTDYTLIPLSAAQAAHLSGGPHTLAVHCTQTEGGQFIDLGMVRVTR